MSGGCLNVLPALCALAWIPAGAVAQSVVSARSGVVHFADGEVYIGDEKLQPQIGRFPMLPEGGQIRTGQGHAELLLTPGVFLRMGENSAVRMVTSDLEDTQVELTSGSATIDCTQTGPGTSLTVAFQRWQMHFVTKGLYRLDSEPPALWVRTGVAEVRAGNEAAVTVERGMRLPLAPVLVPERPAAQPEDALSDWSMGRRQSVLADDAIAAQIDQDPASGGNGIAGMSYFPLIGLPAVDPGYYGGMYDTYYAQRQPGFSSVYLPGYWSQPVMFLGLGSYGYRPAGGTVLPAPGQYRQLPSTGVGGRYHVPVVPPARAPITRPAVVVPSAPAPSAPHPIGHVGAGRGR